jgi:uncharacterized protein DUF6677
MASQSTNTIPPPPPPRQYSLVGGVLSYLIPGLGQIYQGRVGKGVLFMSCLLAMFIGGQYLGDWQNVYLPDLARGANDVIPWDNNPWHLPPILHPLANVYHRWHFAGQFWIGMAAWPALWQYNKLPVPDEQTNAFWHNFQRWPEDENKLNKYLTNNDKTPDVAWVYTVIAGVLNILVIYDAFAGPAYILQPTRPNEVKTQEEVAVP